MVTGNSITIKAEAVAYDATISKVEFYENNALIGEDATAPYEFTLSNVAPGSHAISAKVIDNKNQSVFLTRSTLL